MQASILEVFLAVFASQLLPHQLQEGGKTVETVFLHLGLEQRPGQRRPIIVLTDQAPFPHDR